MGTRLRVWMLVMIAAAALLAGAGRALAGGPVSVSARLSSNKTYIGDAVTLQIVVDGSNTAEQPVIPPTKDLSFDFLGGTDASSRSITIINGRRTDQSTLRYVFQYRVTPQRGGVLTVPAITVRVNGADLTTEPMTIAALEPSETADFKLRIELSKTEAYVGEPVLLTVTWYLTKPAQPNVLFSMPDAGGAYELMVAPDSRPVTGGVPGRQARPVLQFLDSSVACTPGQGTLDGRTFTTYSFTEVLVPRHPGKLIIGPMRLAFDAVTGERAPSMFDFPMESRATTERRVITAPAVELSATPLPEEGRPANFSGLVGEYGIRAAASPAAVNVGDPITLTVTVTGPPPLELVQPLALGRQRSLVQQFKLPTDPVFPTISKEGAAFAYTIRARSDAVKEVPPIELPYFDTKERAYRTATSPAIPLSVRPTTSVAVPDLAGAEPDAPPPDQKPGGIAPIIRGAGTLTNGSIDLTRILAEPAWLTALAAPPALYLGAAGLMFARRRAAADPAGQRRKRAVARAGRALRAAGRGPATQLPAAVSEALRTFIADMAGRPEAGLTADEAIQLATGVESGGSRRLTQLLRRCESAQFAGGAVDPQELLREARAIIAELAPELRRAS